MNEVVYKNALYEVYEILTYINEQSRNKIPNKLIEYIKENKSVEYEFEINKNITIEKQKLLPETEAFITIIYRDYICPKDKRDELDKIIKDNDLKFEIKLKEKYKEDLFKKNKKNQNLPVEIKKEKILKRIINYIKSNILLRK